MINNECHLKLNDGQTVNLVLNFKLLLKVKQTNPIDYEKFNKVVLFGNSSKTDIFEMLSTIYVAYLCANIEEEKKYTYDEFVVLVPFDLQLIGMINQKLLGIRSKKK